MSKGTRKDDVNSIHPKNDSLRLFLRLLVRGPSQSNVLRFILPLTSDLLSQEQDFLFSKASALSTGELPSLSSQLSIQPPTFQTTKIAFCFTSWLPTFGISVEFSLLPVQLLDFSALGRSLFSVPHQT